MAKEWAAQTHKQPNNERGNARNTHKRRATDFSCVRGVKDGVGRPAGDGGRHGRDPGGGGATQRAVCRGRPRAQVGARAHRPRPQRCLLLLLLPFTLLVLLRSCFASRWCACFPDSNWTTAEREQTASTEVCTSHTKQTDKADKRCTGIFDDGACLLAVAVGVL